MACKERRASYVKEFVQSLAAPGDDREDILQHVLRETMEESLVELEKRFKFYSERHHHEENPQNMESAIRKMENNANARFFKKKRSGVKHTHRQALRNCYTTLKNDLDLFQTSLMDDLLAFDLISVSDKDSIRVRGTQKGQNEEFYSYLVGRLTLGEFYKIFLPALRKDHAHLADALLTEMDRLEEEYQDSQCVACRARKYVQLKRLANPLLMMKAIEMPLFTDLKSPGLSNNSKWVELRQAVSDADIIKAMEKKYPDFYQEFQLQCRESMDCHCTNVDVLDTAVPDTCDRTMPDQDSISTGFETCLTDFSDTDGVDDCGKCISFQFEDLEQEYEMTANPKGICLIINNTIFPGRRLVGHGLEDDVENATASFRRLQFTVDLKTNLTSVEMKATLEEYAKNDHSTYNAFICVIMTSGGAAGVLGTDGELVQVSDLTSYFKATSCPSLAGKPKLFFIQASRGEMLMDGFTVKKTTKEEVADEADFFIGYSTVEGYASFRNTVTGYYYIKALAALLNSHADQRDLLSCMTLINKEMSRLDLYPRGTHCKQMPATVFTLTKKVRFASNPLWPHTEEMM